MKLANCKLVELPTFTDGRGNLTVIEGDDRLPFDIRRIYYLYEVPDGQVRGAHAHKELRQLLIAMSGSLDIVLDDGTDRRRFTLDRPDRGLLVGSMIWRSLENFSDGAVCCVLASTPYLDSDYIRNYDEFVAMVRAT
jgi:hypothetical protein